MRGSELLWWGGGAVFQNRRRVMYAMTGNDNRAFHFLVNFLCVAHFSVAVVPVDCSLERRGRTDAHFTSVSCRRIGAY